ncbi:MAG: SDR family oxidoreductase [Gemmataceae bacterium]|nr:SDR family oxidoreductase [Gemmataceae bacterium]
MSRRPVALITGSGAQRVGAVVAASLADRFDLVLHYRSAKAEAESAIRDYQARGINAIAVQADLTQEAEVARLVEQAVRQFGRLDAVVHCAADWKPKRLEAVTAHDVRHYLDTNTLSSFLIGQHAGLALTRQPAGGCIVLVGDWACARPYTNYAAYFPSKGAIPTLTRTLAVELGSRNPNVRVNAVLPGPVMLPPEIPADERARVINATLVRREGKPENVAHAVSFLIDNDFVTGVCLPVDGGRSIYAPDSVGANS